MKAKTKKIMVAIGIVAVLAVSIAAGQVVSLVLTGAPVDATVKLRAGATIKAATDSLTAAEDATFAARVARCLTLLNADLSRSEGAYNIKSGDSPLSVARRMRNRQQSPVRFTFNNVRTKQQFAARFASRFMADSAAMMATLSDKALLDSLGYDEATVVCALLPDSYEFYWNVSPAVLLTRLNDYRNRFWTAERRAKAAALGLTPEQVQTVASIVEEETAKADEKPLVARLYLNRVARHMPLQADPTVKYAIGDFSIRRLTIPMTRVESPYNTYRIEGLPPGPIRLAEKATIDAVLDAPEHDYTYMCAKEDFSGYHNFAADYATHQANARRYQAELNRRGIR